MRTESADEIQLRFIDEMIRCNVSKLSKIINMAGTVNFALALKIGAARTHIMAVLPAAKAQEIKNIIGYFGPIRMIDAIDAMEEIIYAARILDQLMGEWTEEPETSLVADEGKPLKIYKFKRRYLALNWEKHMFAVVRGEKCEIVHNSLDSAWKQLRNLLDEKESEDGIIDYWQAGVDEIWDGLYIDENLEYPQLASIYRMHWDGGKTFDYIFYSEEGGYEGENDKFLFLSGSVFKRRSS